ncbi:MAG: CDP-glycerol glycerophosphotransferase family protein [Oscillospiraceae bacterium]|nr:CDP-glycerol glycerophosphotransferase family protein [Oscillospiraceae bacterium]
MQKIKKSRIKAFISFIVTTIITLFRFITSLFYRSFACAFHFFRVCPIRPNKIVLFAPHRVRESLDCVVNELIQRGKTVYITPAQKRSPRLLLLQAYHFATASAVLLNDNFMPLGSLRFSKKTKIVQIWHAEGALKRFGLSLDLPQAVRECVRKAGAKYDAVVCSSPRVAPFYAEAFGVPLSVVLPLGAPRLDVLCHGFSKQKAREAFELQFPQTKNKRIILYAPTLRDNPKADAALLENFRFDQFQARFGANTILLVRVHPRSAAKIPSETHGVIDCAKYSDTIKLLAACDALITDYSSICLDAAVLDVPVFLYCFDLDAYKTERDFYVDFSVSAPCEITVRFADLLDELAKPDVNQSKRAAFAAYHIGTLDGGASKRIADFLTEDKQG